MTEWFATLPLFPDEDEATLKEAFAQLWAKYPNRHVPEIGYQLFSKLREPMRGMQCASAWSQQLDVIERRDEIRRYGVSDVSDLPDRTQLVRELLVIARDTGVEPRDRNKAYEQSAKLLGFLKEDDGDKSHKLEIVISGTDAKL